MKIKIQKKSLTNRAKIMCCMILLSFTVLQNAFAQNRWEHTYFNIQTYGQKGDKTDDTGYVSTGKTRISECLPEQAYLIKTDTAGTLQWYTALGDSNYYFHGTSVKKTTGGGYVVVGSTTKGQKYEGNRHGRFCEDLDPYHNAFIAYVDPINYANNWFIILGDTMTDDYALDVIEDSAGNFVFTGAANGKLPCSVTCDENNTSVCTGNCSPTYDLLLVRTTPAGGLLNYVRYNFPGVDYLIGTSLVYSAINGNYAVTGVSGFNTSDIPVLLFDNNFNLINAQRYGTNDNINQEARSIIETNNGDYVVVGRHDAAKSFAIRINNILVKLGGSILDIPNYSLRYEDVLESILDTSLFVTSATAKSGTQLNTEMAAMKLQWNGIGFVPVSLPGGNNIALYGDDKEINANLVSNEFWETVYDPVNHIFNIVQTEEYHLFGNTQYTDSKKSEAYYANTDKNLATGCEGTDSVVYNYEDYLSDSFWPSVYDIDSLGSFDIVGTYFSDSVFCERSNSSYSKRINKDDLNRLYDGVLVYPNPASASFNLIFQSTENGTGAKLAVFNQVGQQVITKTNVSIKQGQNNINVTSANLNTGVYWGVLTAQGKSRTFKIIINR